MSADIGPGTFVEWITASGPSNKGFIGNFPYEIKNLTNPGYCSICNKDHNGLHFTNGPYHRTGWTSCEFKPIDKPDWWDELHREVDHEESHKVTVTTVKTQTVKLPDGINS